MANYVKFKQGLKKDFNTTNQPLTNGMIYFVIDENNHGSIYYDTIVDGEKATKNGAVHRVKFSGLPIKITGSVIGTGVISQNGETIEINTSTNHSHGLAHQDFTVTLSNDDTNLKWTRLGNQNGGGFWLKSIRGQAKTPAWFQPDYSAGIAFGGADTKGIISVRYSQPSVRFAGGNGDAPVWYFTITGSNDKTYDLNGIGGHSSDSAKLDHNVTFKIASTADATKGGSGTATNLSGSAVDLYLPTKISGFDLLQASRFQGNADTSTVAAKLGRGGNTSLPMTFNWNGQGGQPTWLWGGENGTDMYVYNPSNFRVAHSVNTAGLDHDITFKISKVANATTGETGITTKLTENAITFTIPSDLSGFNNIQSTRFQGTADNADTVDYFHVAEEKYKYETTKTQPTSGANWCIKISTSDWNRTSETIYLTASGNNTSGTVILKTGSRQNNWWGYATNYNGTGIIGVYKLVSNSDDVYIKVNGAYTSVRIRTTFNPTISIPATIPDYKFTSVPYQGGFFSNAIYTDNLTFTTPKYWANIPISDNSKTDTQPTFNTAYVSNWWRSTGNTGWWNETHSGGITMEDNTYVKVAGNKSFLIPSGSLKIGGNGNIFFATGNDDATLKIYGQTNTDFGTETIAIQTCFDNQDPQISNYTTQYENRCNLLLQPRGGQVYIGKNLTAPGDVRYKLLVSGNQWIEGNLVFKGAKEIKFIGSKATYSMIRFIDNTSDNYGNGISIGGGGSTVIGAGESAMSYVTNGGDERLFLLSDGAINIEAGGNTISDRKGLQVTSDGHILPIKAENSNPNAQDLGSAADYWRNLYINNIILQGQTGNRLVWTNGSKILQAGYHYADTDRIAINTAGRQGYNFYVNGSSYFSGNTNVCKVYNSANYNNSDSLTLTQLAAYNNASCGMINAATDNPRGAAGWVHVWSQAWNHGTTSSWVSQIALNVQDGAGMWYRTTSGNIEGRAWIRVLDTNNYTGILDGRYVNVTGDTMTGNLNFANNKGINGLMAGGSDYWEIIGSGTEDNGRLKIKVGDNATTDWLDFEFKDCSDTPEKPAVYNPMQMTGNKVIINCRLYEKEWIQFDNYTGLYSPNNNAHLFPNNISAYGQWVIKGSKGSYSGIHLGENTNYMTIMDSGEHKGLFQQGQDWIVYYRKSSNQVGIRTSNLSGYSITCKGDVYVQDGWLRTTSSTGWYSETYGGGWHMTDSTYIRNYGGKTTRLDNLCLGADNNNYRLYVNGTSYFNGNVYFPNNRTIYQNQNDTSNYTTIVNWLKGSTSQKDANGNAYSYQPQIGQHNTGGTNSLGSICILPYATSSEPWSGIVGLFITKNRLMLDNCRIPTTGNTSGTIGSATVPVYSDSGVLKTITSYSGNAATATTASKLSKNAGSATKPIYFSGGVPVQCNDTLGVNISGNAATATKLQTTRNIILNGNLQGSASFNGTGDATITALNYQSSVSGGNTYNYPWHRIATTVVGTGQYNDKSALLRIRHTFNGGGEGLVKVSVRTNSAGSGCDISAIWLYRYNIAANNIGIGLWGVTGDNVYLDVYYKCAMGWPRAIVESISNGRIFTLISSYEVDNTTTTDKKTSSEVYTSIENGATLIRGKAYTKIVYGSDGTDNGRYVLKSGDTMTGALNLANGTWNKAGDDAQFGDNNTPGSFAIQGINGNTNLKMVTYGNSSYGTITWNGSQFVFSHDISGTLNGNATTATNADKLDGYHESSFLRYSGWWGSDSGQNINNANGMVFAYSSHGLPGSWGIVTTFDYSKDSAYRHQIYGDGWNNEMYFRTCSSDRGGWNAWRHLLDTVNYTGILDSRYVLKTGDTMTGELKNSSNDFTLSSDSNEQRFKFLNASKNKHTVYFYKGASTSSIIVGLWDSTDGQIWTYNTSGYFNLAKRVVIGGYNNSNYSLSTSSFICDSWIRTTGPTGWYNETYDGGWYMSDNTYIRNYNSKHLYITGRLGVNCELRLWEAGRQITRAGNSVAWINGRDGALIRQDSYTGYNPIFSCKTTNGSWELGPYDNNILYFAYGTDSNHKTGNNSVEHPLRLMPGKGVLLSALNYGTSLPSSGTNGQVFFKI